MLIMEILINVPNSNENCFMPFRTYFHICHDSLFNYLNRNPWSHVWFPLQEIAEPLFDLKHGMEQLARNQTFKRILATLLAIGNFLNGSSVSAASHLL